MKANLCRLAALVALWAAPSLAQAQCCWRPIPQAPDYCSPGYYYTNCYGAVYGPTHNVYPPCGPWNGVVPGPPPGQQPKMVQLPNGQVVPAPPQSPTFPTHPFARSPRDFFMVDEYEKKTGYGY